MAAITHQLRAPRAAATAVPLPAPHEQVVIEPRPIGTLRRVAEVWKYRGLLPFFGWTYIRKFYGNTWLGWLWIPLRLLLTLGVRVFVFGAILNTPTGGVPYFIFFALGLGAWELIQMTWWFGTRSLELNRRYLKRIYIPRLSVLVAAVAPGLMWCAVYMLILLAASIYFLIAKGTFYLHLGPHTLLAVAGGFLMVGMGYALSCWTSVIGGMGKRDPRFMVRQILHLWFYLTPVIYPLGSIPGAYKNVLAVNPLTAPMEMIHLGVLGKGQVRLSDVLISVGTIVVVGFFGLRFLNRSEALTLDSI
jgi:lipopolysaccharide transport system permease protein